MVHYNNELFYTVSIQSWPHDHKLHSHSPLLQDPDSTPGLSSLSDLEIRWAGEKFLVLKTLRVESREDSKEGVEGCRGEHGAFDDTAEPSQDPVSLFFETD